MIALMLCACSANDRASVNLGDVEEYKKFLEKQDEIDAPDPFNAEPLSVNAVGKVRAQPDIAVITATIRAEHKNESQAFNDMSEIVNAVQDSLATQDVETGFTRVNSSRNFDQTCLNANQLSTFRQSEIQNDYRFNRNLEQRGDTETKRRIAKRRLPQQVCPAISIEVSTNMVIRIKPAEAAGDALSALTEAGAAETHLFGYDYTDYDALYQKAAVKAVKLAREKAEMIARRSGAALGEIESFTISRPARTSRFGPQPNVIRPANRYTGQAGSVVDRQTNRRKQTGQGFRGTSYGQYVPPPNASGADYDQDVPISATTASSGFTQFASIERQITSGTQTTTNALSMSLLSGPQTISVTANLSFDYETPLDDKIIVDGE